MLALTKRIPTTKLTPMSLCRRAMQSGLALGLMAIATSCTPSTPPSGGSPGGTAVSGATVGGTAAGGKTGSAAIAVTQIVEHPALDAVRDGLKAELAQLGYEEGKTLQWTWQTAQGNPSTAAQIARQFVGEQPQVIVAISTPSAQAAASAAQQKIPVVFSAVTDPVGAKLVASLEKPGGMVTGVSALTPVDQHLDLIREITPQAKRIGVLYNAGESNSVTLVNLLKQVAPQRAMTIVEATAANSSGVATAAQSLVGQTDAIYIPTDNTIVSALESVIQVGIQNKLPVYAGDTDSVKRGAIATLSFDYADVGRETAKVVDRILKGESPATIPVVSPQKLELAVNATSASQMGVTIPKAVLDRATP